MIVILLLVLILYIPIKLRISYKKSLFETFLSFGFIKIKIPLNKEKKQKEKNAINTEKKEKENKDGFDAFTRFFSVIQGFYNASHLIKKALIIEKLEIKSSFGTEDAAFTGLAVGLAYSEIYKLIGFLSVIFTFEPPKIDITPIFEDRYVFNIECKSIIKTKLAHIIFAGYKFYTSYKKALKGKD